MRASASDLLEQAANLIDEHAQSPVRIECRTDRTPAPVAQKLAQACASALTQYLVDQEKTNVKFAAAGFAVPPPPPDPRDPFSPLPVRQQTVLIVFGKK